MFTVPECAQYPSFLLHSDMELGLGFGEGVDSREFLSLVAHMYLRDEKTSDLQCLFNRCC